MTNIQEIVRSYSNRIKDGRTLRKIYKHAQSEMRELDYELRLYAEGLPPGEDGIVGEAHRQHCVSIGYHLQSSPGYHRRRIKCSYGAQMQEMGT